MIAFLDFVLLTVFVGGSWVFVTQIAYPLYRGTVLFPIFRKERVLHDQLAEVKQAKVEKSIEEEIKREKGA
jgi:hypothetical protein